MKILVFYVDKQYFNMVILFLRLRVRRELIIRRDGRAVEGTGLENRRCKNLEAITVSRFFLFMVKTFLLRFGIVPSVGYIVGDIVVYFTDFVLQLTLLFIILSWAEDSSSSHEIDSVEYR